MKINFILMFTIAFLFIGCQQEVELEYSCDKELNSWVKENLSTICKMDSNEFLEMEISRQRAIYNAFTPEQRQAQWIFKVENVLNMSWTDSENKHLRVLLSKIQTTSELFSGQLSEIDREEFSIWTYKWIVYAEDTLGWSSQLIGSIIGMPQRLSNKEGVLEIKENISRIKGRSESTSKSCNCYAVVNSNDCKTGDTCVVGLYNCSSTSFGCGLFWLEGCNGLCWLSYPN